MAKDDEDSQKNKATGSEQISTLFSFAIFGVLISYTFTLMISAAQDILAGTSIQTSTVLIANRGPSSLISFIAPYFMAKIPYSVRMSFVVVASAGGYLVAALAHQVEWKLVGVALASLGNGVASISAIALASYFHVNALSAYSTGTGFGFFGSPAYYTALTTWFCVSPSMTILFMTPLAFLYLVSYYVANKNRSSDDNPDDSSYNYERYTKLQQFDEEDSDEAQSQGQVESETLTTKEKIAVIKNMMCRLFVPVFIGFFSQYILLQALVTTISYENAPFPPRDHYQYYIFIYMFGEFIGRCHRSVLRSLNTKCIYEQTWIKLWIVSMIQVTHVVFFGFESWYRFLPGVGPALFLTFTAGLAIGVLFNNMLEYLSVALDGKEREFMLGYVSFPMFAGSLVAALIGIYVELALRNHCISIVPNGAYCLTRAPTSYNLTSNC